MSETTKKKVLIVEDETAIRNVLADALAQAGFEVLQARDGQDALIEALSGQPDLILLDVLMPRMDGRATLKALSGSSKTKGIPVIFLTNLNELDTISEAIEGNVVGYIVKSDWSIEDVIKKVKAQLGGA